MFTVGDTVEFTLDGARGVVIGMEGDFCHVMWEDMFVSWERADSLKKVE
jgi:hypothetical protein